jgi:SAM-dependent methyltransferase
MDIIQDFYDSMAPHYDKLFFDWRASVGEQAAILDRLFRQNGSGRDAKILDCACGIGTQSIGLAALGYPVTASDISAGALDEAKRRAAEAEADIRFERADLRALGETFSEVFDIIICMDNALPHMLSHDDLVAAVGSITDRLVQGGMFVASIRDYDALLQEKPSYSPPYIHQTEKGRRVSFQTWDWDGELYRLVQYIIDDEEDLQIGKFRCIYRATRREELTALLRDHGCSEVVWYFPEQTGLYQPMVVARKGGGL